MPLSYIKESELMLKSLQARQWRRTFRLSILYWRAHSRLLVYVWTLWQVNMLVTGIHLLFQNVSHSRYFNELDTGSVWASFQNRHVQCFCCTTENWLLTSNKQNRAPTKNLHDKALLINKKKFSNRRCSTVQYATCAESLFNGWAFSH